MYKFYITISLLFFTFTKAQINTQFLPNEWIKTKTRMLDGSKNISEAFLTSKFNRWKITNQKLYTVSDPISANGQSSINYKLQQNFIKTSEESGYEIQKLTQDSLILIERINGIKEDDKIKKHWFIRSSIIKKKNINVHKNDSVVIANEHFTPTLNKGFAGDFLKEFNKKSRYPVFNLVGNIIFYPKKEKLQIQISNNSDQDVIKNQKNIDFIKTTIEKTYSNWNLNDFKNFNKVYLPFVIRSYYNRFDGGTSSGTTIFYFINDPNDIEKIYGIKMEDLILSNENFQKGVKAIEKENYEKAINYFLKSYEIDNRKIDALYNIVSIYSFKQDKINECKYLKMLMDLEQTEGIRNYNEKCIKQ